MSAEQRCQQSSVDVSRAAPARAERPRVTAGVRTRYGSHSGQKTTPPTIKYEGRRRSGQRNPVLRCTDDSGTSSECTCSVSCLAGNATPPRRMRIGSTSPTNRCESKSGTHAHAHTAHRSHATIDRGKRSDALRGRRIERGGQSSATHAGRARRCGVAACTREGDAPAAGPEGHGAVVGQRHAVDVCHDVAAAHVTRRSARCGVHHLDEPEQHSGERGRPQRVCSASGGRARRPCTRCVCVCVRARARVCVRACVRSQARVFGGEAGVGAERRVFAALKLEAELAEARVCPHERPKAPASEQGDEDELTSQGLAARHGYTSHARRP
jgi:hypothetical protein